MSALLERIDYSTGDGCTDRDTYDTALNPTDYLFDNRFDTYFDTGITN